MASPAKRPCFDVSRELMDAIAREDWTEVKNILSETSPHVADNVVTQLINEGQWSAARRVIRCVKDEDRTWNIEGIVVKSSILLSVAERDWTCLKESPSERFPDSTFQWIIRQACIRATENEDFQYVLPHCADDRLDSVLTILVERRQWLAVGEVLVGGVSDSMKQWAVREACEHCKNESFGTFGFCSSFYYSRGYVTVEQFLIRIILPHCAVGQLDSVLTTLVERRLWHAVLYVLKRGVSDFSERWVVLEVCACCESDDIQDIPPELFHFCADDQVDCVQTTLVERHQWRAVGGMLKKGVSDSNKQWAVQEACKHCQGYALESLIVNILPHCAVDQLDSVVTTLVERRVWQAVGVILKKKGVSDSNKKWAVQEACKHCEGYELEYLIQNILPHCAVDQLDSVLTTLVERRLWQAVGVTLKKKGVSDSNKQWAVRQACKHCERCELESLIQNILPHCAVDQLDSVLTTLVERRLWHAVLYVLKRGVSDSSKRWVVLEVCSCCESVDTQDTPSEIFHFCADDQVDCVLTTLVERRQWRAVEGMLKKGVNDSYKQWAVQEACKHCEDYELESLFQDILSHCADDKLDSVLPTLVKRHQWRAVRMILKKKGVNDSNIQWAVQEACKHCKGYELESLIQDILSHCADDQLDSVLTTLVERHQWRAVRMILKKKGVSDSNIQWVVQEACKHCKGNELESLIQIILPHCADNKLDSVLTTLVERHQWQAVRVILHKKGVSDSNKQWAVQEACKHCKGNELESLIQDILSHCADDQLDSVLTTLVERHQWRAVRMILKKKGVSDSNIQWVVQEACKHCEGYELESLILIILPHCAVDELESVLTTLVERHQWLAVRVILQKKGVSDSNKQRTLQEACKHCEGYEVKSLIQNILPHCAVDQLDSVLTTLVERRLWQAVLYVLKRGVSDSSKRWVVLEVCACCESVSQDHTSSDILLFCADDQADCVLTTLVERRQWIAVGEMLKESVSDFNKQWAVQEACKQHTHNDFKTNYTHWGLHSQSHQEYYLRVEQYLVDDILPHCAANQLDSVLTTLMARRLWHAVLYVLKRGVSDSSKRWVMMEVCKCCKSGVQVQVFSDILLFCPDDQADSVLITLVEQRQWRAVGEMMKKGVSDSNKQWAVQEACTHCKEHDVRSDHTLWRLHLQSKQELDSPGEQCLVDDILPNCAYDQLDSVLTTLVERRLWRAVMYVLKRGVSDSSKRWLVLEVCACCESGVQEQVLSDILLVCANDHADFVLTTLVERRLWHAVLYVLKRGVGDSSKRWVVLEVCACCESGVQEQFLSDILLLCADDQADFVLTTLVERLQWEDVGELKLVVKLLQRGVSETVAIWAVEQASKGAKSDDFIKYVLPHCSLSHLNSAMPNLVKQGELTAVNIVMQRHRKDMEINSFVLPRWYVDVLPLFVERSLWNYVQDILHSVVKKSFYHWTKRVGEINEDDSVVWAIVNTCPVNATCAVRLFRAAKEKVSSKVRELHECLGLTEDLCELLYTSFLDQVCVELCSEEKKTDVMTNSIRNNLREIYTEIASCIQTISTNSVEGVVGHFKSEARKMISSGKLSSISVHHFLYFLKQLNFYYICERRNGDDEVLLMMFAVLPLSPVLQSVALRIMLRHKRWDVISQADLSGVWEQDRRHLLQAAVKQRQWSVVKQWADHTLYDDQRVWALNEALNDKQWDVALLLADHGLTDIDLMRVHYRLAKYADWDVILHMFERGADVEEVKERLGRMKDNKRISEKSQRFINDRHSQVKALEKTIQNAKVSAWKNACRRCNWMFALYALHRNPGKESVPYALKVATKKKAWHIVMQLVRLGMDSKQRHSLFSRMMKRRQWGVCRVLLEQGLSVQLCLKVLPKLMDMNQWALVARVMEHDVGDDVRQQVMQRAWERREGSVVWLCIKSLPTPLSVEEREALFQRAFSCELWQVIKPLVEEKDVTGIRHRDTALLEAIEQHEWDLVDHCQRYHADINMKDDDGHTPLQRAAMKKDWEAVGELVVRDGDPNLMDTDGNTVLHRAIEAQQWGIVNLLIQYQADIHEQKKSPVGTKGVTPLGMLIDTRRMDMIEHTLLWCPDQSKGANHEGETTLHVACLSGYHDSIYYLVARRVNPLAVTNMGQSALVYAVQNEDSPQRMVAECIKLGFSTHQPNLTNNKTDLKSLIPKNRGEKTIWFPGSAVSSPFLCALLRGLPVVMQMLYESGACSQRELFRLYTELPKLADPNTNEGRQLQAPAIYRASSYNNFVSCIADALPYLTEIATTPRSLESTCRLVISHCLTLSKTRHRDVDQLPLTERMKNFVLFSDLTDPDFGEDTT